MLILSSQVENKTERKEKEVRVRHEQAGILGGEVEVVGLDTGGLSTGDAKSNNLKRTSGTQDYMVRNKGQRTRRVMMAQPGRSTKEMAMRQAAGTVRVMLAKIRRITRRRVTTKAIANSQYIRRSEWGAH